MHLDVSTSTGSLHQKNENITSLSVVHRDWVGSHEPWGGQLPTQSRVCLFSWHIYYLLTVSRTGWRNDVFILLMKILLEEVEKSRYITFSVLIH